MLQKNNGYRVFKVFYDSPTSKFGLREISRKIGLALPSVKRYLKDLERQKLIRVEEDRGNPVYFAEMDSVKFREYSRVFIQYELFESGVIDFIWKKLCPDAIILYGSVAKGESTERSDIDLFVIVNKRSSSSGPFVDVKINLEKFEKILGKSIHLIVDSVEKIPKELKNNLTNGIVMKGYFKAW
jgi:predicted nucleotidyltransferase